MKHMTTRKIPAKTESIVSRVTCDLCGTEIKKGRYEVNMVDVKHRVGNEYPEGGSGDETSVDMCGECFDTKLVPWLREQGAEPHTKEWDWG